MDYYYICFWRKILACCTLIVLTCFILGSSQSNQDLSSDNMLLNKIRDRVIQNERSFNLIKVSYRSQYDYTIPKSELEIERYDNTAMRKIGGRKYSHKVGIWAQDGIKQYFSPDSYYSPDELAYSDVFTVNGEVMKWAIKPDLMQGGIANIEKFQWSRIGIQHLGLRPLGFHKLSEFLVPENAIIHTETEFIGDRESYVIDAKRPFQDEDPYYARIWIDCERYMPLKIQQFGYNDPSSRNSRPHAEVIGIKLYQLPNGGWFPVEGTHISYRQEPKPHQRLSHITVDVNSITIKREDIPDSLFEIDFPEGAKVYNDILGITVEQGKGESLIVEKIVDNSIEEIGYSTAVSEPVPDSNKSSTTIPPKADESTKFTTEELSKQPTVEPTGEQSFSFVLILVSIAVTAFALTLIILIIRHNSKISLTGKSK